MPFEWFSRDPEPSDDRPKFGEHTDLTEVMALLRSDLPISLAVADLDARYPWLEQDAATHYEARAFIRSARSALSNGDVPAAERLAHAFIHRAFAAKPEPPERRRHRRRWPIFRRHKDGSS